MSNLTFPQELFLRTLTGKEVGRHLLSEFNKLVFISAKNMLCTSLASAAQASFMAETGGRCIHLLAEEDNMQTMVKSAQAEHPDAVVLIFGGEAPLAQSKRLFVETVNALADADMQTEIVVHVRMFAEGGIELAAENQEVLDYLMDRDVLVYSFDIAEGLMHWNLLHWSEQFAPELVPIAEFPLTHEHTRLLSLSLRGK